MAGLESISAWSRIGHPRYRRLVLWLVLAGLGSGVIAYVENHLLEAVGLALMGGERPAWAPLAAFVVAHLSFVALAHRINLLEGELEKRGRDDLEKALLQHLLRRGDDFYGERSPGEIINRLGTDVRRVGRRRILATEVVGAAIMVAANVIFFAQHSLWLGVAAALTCAAGAIVTHRLTRPVAEMDRAFLYADDRAKARFEDLLEGVEEIQVGGLYARAEAYFVEHQRERSRQYMDFVRLRARVVVSDKLGYLIALAVMVALVALAPSGGRAASVAMFAVVLKALPHLYKHAAELVYQRLEFRRTAACRERLDEYDAAWEGAEPTPGALEARPASGDPLRLDLASATYRYRAADGRLTGGIADVDTSFERGGWIGIVGPAGSGKSTLLQVLLGRARPQAGAVRLGGRCLGAIPPSERHTALSVLPQRVQLFDSTLRHNLTFGLPMTASDALEGDERRFLDELGVVRLAREKALDMALGEAGLAHAARFVELRPRILEALGRRGVELTGTAGALDPAASWLVNLLGGSVSSDVDMAQVRAVMLDLVEATAVGDALFAAGLEYEVGKKGSNLSGGQRQLVALARAVLRDTPVLVLDEPTSALDPVSTERVLRALDAWRRDRILITVSHDPRVVMSADEARVMEGGAIVASGSVADLRRRGGHLRRCLSA